MWYPIPYQHMFKFTYIIDAKTPPTDVCCSTSHRFWCVTPSDVAPTTENICSDNEPVAATTNDDQNTHQQQQPTQAKPIWAQQNAVLPHNPTACYLRGLGWHEAPSSNYLGPGQTRLDLLHDGKEFQPWTRRTAAEHEQDRPENKGLRRGFRGHAKLGPSLSGGVCVSNQSDCQSLPRFVFELIKKQAKEIHCIHFKLDYSKCRFFSSQP